MSLDASLVWEGLHTAIICEIKVYRTYIISPLQYLQLQTKQSVVENVRAVVIYSCLQAKRADDIYLRVQLNACAVSACSTGHQIRNRNPGTGIRAQPGFPIFLFMSHLCSAG